MMELKKFQEKAISKIIREAKEILEEGRKGTIVFQSPTGSGKTFTMSKIIENLALDGEFSSEDLCFLWVSIGKGELHKQSYASLKKYFKGAPTTYLLEQEFTGGRNVFDKNDVVVLNWEKLRAKDSRTGDWKNILMKDKETYNFIDIVNKTKEQHRKIVLIIDESHSNTTSERAIELRDEIIKPDLTIEMSATPALNQYDKLVKVSPFDPINEELIKKEVIINPDIDAIVDDDIDSQTLIMEVAFNKRLELKKAHNDLGLNINPLVLIQLPNSDEGNMKKEFVEKYLRNNGITTDNHKLAIWLSEEKQHTEREFLTPNDSDVEFLIFKQAIDTGWDCPRAQILVKFRETQSITFEIQTVGRILRMPEAKHYENEILNRAYVYSNIKSIDVAREDYNPNILKNLHSRRKHDYSVLSLRSYYKQRLDFGDIKNSRVFYPVLEEAFCSEFNLDKNKKGSLNLAKNKKLISSKVKLSSVINEDEIILDKTIEAQFVDELKEIKSTHNHKVKLSEDDKILILNKLIKDNINGYGYKRSLPSVKEALYRLFRDYLNTKEMENEIPYIQAIILNNAKLFSILIDKAIETYEPIHKEGLDKKELMHWDNTWEIPEGRSFNPHTYEKFDAKFSLYSPCYIEIKKSNPEKWFIEEFLESNPDKISWWWKNGDEHMRENFGIQKPDEYSFQPDFIVLFNDGRLGVFDTKTAGDREEDIKIKSEALQKYLNDENAKGKNLLGGIIIKEGEHFRINQNATYNSYISTPCDWGYLLDII